MDTPSNPASPHAPERGWILYDGQCPLCAGLARRFTPFLLRRGFAPVPLQSPWAAERLGLKAGEIPDEMKLLTPSGALFGGHHAFAQIARLIWWAWPAYALSRLPGMEPACMRVYRWVADRRHLILRAAGRPATAPWARAIRWGIGSIWLFHGLFGKIMGGIPRHQLIVARILGETHALPLTKLIGVGEVMMAAWMVSGIAPKRCAAAQTLLLIGMNTLELSCARDLLLAPLWMVAANLLLLSLAWIAAFRGARPQSGR